MANDNRITEEQVTALIGASKVEDVKMGEKTTVVSVTLPNGFVIVQSSSCVDPANYDHELGKQICLKRVEDKVWELEGYRLQASLSQ
jgi:hypothetical protein